MWPCVGRIVNALSQRADLQAENRPVRIVSTCTRLAHKSLQRSVDIIFSKHIARHAKEIAVVVIRVLVREMDY
jgi:hypothetical protein